MDTKIIAGIEVEGIIGGVLQRVSFVAGASPIDAVALLREIDANAQFRDAFPVRGMSGNRPTLEAKALVISAEVKDAGAFIRLTAQNAEGDDLTIAVSKKKAGEWLPALEALGKLSNKNLAKVKAAFDGKKAVTVVLSEPEQFIACYWKSDDGSAYLDSMKG